MRSTLSYRIPRSACLLVLLLSACTTQDADRHTLQDGYAKYSAHQVDEADAIASKFIAANPNSPNLDEALYLRGLSRLTRGDKSAAAIDFIAAINKSARPDLKCKGYRALGDIAYDAQRWQDALDDYQKALALNSAVDPLTAHCNYRAGACLQALGQWTPATAYFQRVAAANTDTLLTERAVARMNAGSFALQFGAFLEGPRAAELQSQLKTAGVTATIASELREGKLLYLVRSGSYKTWTEADAARTQLQSKFPLVTIVP